MGKELLRKSSTEEQVTRSSGVHAHFSNHHFHLIFFCLLSSLRVSKSNRLCSTHLPGTGRRRQLRKGSAQGQPQGKASSEGCKQRTDTSGNPEGPGRFFNLNIAADWKWWLITVWWSEHVKKDSHCLGLFLSQAILSLFIYKSTLHPEENRIMIILKITSKSHVTFKVNYCIIRRRCSKVRNCVILQTPVMLKTFIKANTAIIVRTTLLGWLKDLAPCLALHSVPSKRQGRSSKVFTAVCAHCAALSSRCLRPEHSARLSLRASPSPLPHTKPHKLTYILRGEKK